MIVELGTPVRTSDGKDIGKVDRVILNPETQEVRAVVVRKGFLLTRDVEIDIDELALAEDKSVRLTLSSDQVDDLPQFAEDNYLEPPPDYLMSTPYPAGGVYMPASYGFGAPPLEPGVPPVSRPVRDEIVTILNRDDIENAVIREGSKVMSRDGEEVGEVRHLAFDDATGELRHIVIHRGAIFGEDREIPASEIVSADDGLLVLGLDKDQIEAELQ